MSHHMRTFDEGHAVQPYRDHVLRLVTVEFDGIPRDGYTEAGSFQTEDVIASRQDVLIELSVLFDGEDASIEGLCCHGMPPCQ
jgi:hypothetical protein